MKKIVIAFGVVITACFAAFVMNAISQIANLAGRIQPFLGQIVFWSLFGLAALTALYMLFEYFRLPVALIPPANASDTEHARYIEALRRRLKRNRYLKGHTLNTQSEIDDALQQILKPEADAIIRRTAATVFITTAAMQNGRLDGIAVDEGQAAHAEGREHARGQHSRARSVMALAYRVRRGSR